MMKKIGEKTKSEIEAKLVGKGDFVKMDYLRRALDSSLDLDTRRYVLLRLAGIYEERKMYSEAAKLIRSAAEINITFKSKINDYMKAVEMLVRGDKYEDADFVFAQSLALGNEKEKSDMKSIIREYYRRHAHDLVAKDRRSQAKKAYEKLMRLGVAGEDKREVEKELLALYERLGDVKAYMKLKDSL